MLVLRSLTVTLLLMSVFRSKMENSWKWKIKF